MTAFKATAPFRFVHFWPLTDMHLHSLNVRLREVGDAGAFDDMTDEELINAAVRKARELGIAGPREVEDDNRNPR